MKKRILLPLLVVIGLLLAACAKTEVTTNKNAAPSPATKASPASTPATTASTGEKIGVADCDAFIAAYESCVSNKVPEVARAQFKTAVEQWRTSWRQLAANPNTKATLATACKQAADQAKISMKAYNCTF
jgi:hypothetical protein